MLSAPLLVLRQSPSEVETALERVYARPEFAPPARSPLWELISRGFRAIADFLRELLPSFALEEGGRAVVFWIALAVLVGIAAHLVTRFAARRRRRPGERRAARSGVAPAPPVVPTTADEWDALATAMASEGRWRDAASALYHGMLRRLATRGAVRLDPAKTPGDYRRESRHDSESHRLLDRFLRGYEPVAFGPRAADAATYQHLRELARSAADHG